MTKTRLEDSIERNVSSYLEDFEFDVKNEEDLLNLQDILSDFELWYGAISIVSFSEKCSFLTAEWQAILSQSRNHRSEFIVKVADELAYAIAKKYYETKVDLYGHLSPYHRLRFRGIESVPELDLEFGSENRNSINYASDSKTDLILRYASATDTKILHYCPNSNVIYSSHKEVLLDVESSIILDYLMDLYHQKTAPHDLKQKWEDWMSIYIIRP